MDKRPLRRIDKYNPYKLEFSEKENKFKIKFKDVNQKNIYLEIEKEIYDEFNRFELEDLSQMNEYDRHIEHSKLTENTLNKRTKEKEKKVEEIIEEKLEKEKIYEAILKLPIIQRRRIIAYFFKELKLREIAEKENTSIRAIQYSISNAIKNLKKILKTAS